MKLGQQVDGHLAFAPGMRPPWIGRSGQEAFLKAWLTLRDRFYLASHLRKYTWDGVTIIGSGRREQCADSCRRTGNEPTRCVLEFVRFCVMREDRKCANNLVG
jgi:hypothetical protein